MCRSLSGEASFMTLRQDSKAGGMSRILGETAEAGQEPLSERRTEHHLVEWCSGAVEFSELTPSPAGVMNVRVRVLPHSL